MRRRRRAASSTRHHHGRWAWTLKPSPSPSPSPSPTLNPQPSPLTQLEALEASPDEGRLAELRTRNRSQLDALSSELALAFTSSQLDDARRLTAQLQYLQRIHQEIDEQTPAV